MTHRRLQTLEFLRAACALMVLLNHLYDETTGLAQNRLLEGLFSFGVEAVVGFFVLSGCVISLQDYASRRHYVRARLLRILPIYYAVLAGCVALMVALSISFAASELLGNTFFLQSLFWVPLHPLRFFIPSWSLSYELYYYAAFLLLLAWPRLLGPLIAASVLTGAALYFLPTEGPIVWLLHPLSLFCLWLAGVLITQLCRRGFALALPTAAWLMAVGFCLTRLPLSTPAKFDFFRLVGFGIGFAALTWALLAAEIGAAERPQRRFEVGLVWRGLVTAIVLAALWHYSHSYATTEAAFTVVAVVFTVAPKPMGDLVARLVRPILPFMLYVAGLSYALYLVHYPVLQGFNSLASVPAPARVAAVAAASFALAHLLEYRFQPWLRAIVARPPSSGMTGAGVQRK